MSTEAREELAYAIHWSPGVHLVISHRDQRDEESVRDGRRVRGRAAKAAWPAEHAYPRQELLAPELENVQSPNDHTLYTTAWLDLRDGPLVLHVLDMAGRFSTCQLVDAYTNNFSYVSQRTRGFREMDIAIGGPGRSRPVWNVITIVRSSRNDGRQPVLYT